MIERNGRIDDVVKRLDALDATDYKYFRHHGGVIPSRPTVIRILKAVQSVMFPDYFTVSSAASSMKMRVSELYDLLCENYGEEDGKYEHDLTYFFRGTLSEDKYTDDGRVIVRTNEFGRQLTTQYPSALETVRCGVMEDFGDQNQKVLEMWSVVKANKISALSYIMMAILGILAVVMLVTTIRRKMKKRRRMRK